MKRYLMLLLLLAAVLIRDRAAGAEADFTLQENDVFGGMGRSWLQGYQPDVEGDVLTLCLPVSSERAAGRITATLAMRYEDATPFKAQKMSVECAKGQMLYEVQFTLRLLRSRENGDYPATVRVKGKDAAGDPLASEIPVLIRIRDGQAPAPGFHPILSEPEGSLEAGGESALRLTCANTSRSRVMTGVLLSVSDAAGEVMPRGSSLIPLPDLMPGESCPVEVPLLVPSDASANLHTLTFRLTYYALGEAAEWTEAFTLPVTQPIRLMQGGVTMPSSLVIGDVGSLSLPLMNLGKGSLMNATATLTIPGIAEGQSVLVGSIAPGETQTARLSFSTSGREAGEYAGEVIVRCEDAWGTEERFSLPVSLSLEPPAQLSTQTTGVQERGGSRFDLIHYLLIGGCALLICALLIQGSLLRRRIRTLEEERL